MVQGPRAERATRSSTARPPTHPTTSPRRATNMLALRRLALEPGQEAEAPAAHLGVTGELARLPQRYARLSETEYAYEAPSVPFSASLEVDAAGFVRRYPGLWEREP